MPLKAGGEFALIKEKFENAVKLAGQPVKRGTMAHDHDMYMTLADDAAQLRDLETLRKFAPRLEELATRDGHRLYLAIAHRAQGVAHHLAGEHAKAESRLNQAMGLFDELGTHWQIARTLFDLGELEAAQSKKLKARDYFSQALAAFEAIKASPHVERTRDALIKLA